jgi:glycine/D-amino acid oxidase-like deaminating enzyme
LGPLVSVNPMGKNWGIPPWTIDFHSPPRNLPDEVDFAIVGGGFTGLSAAAWLAKLAPNSSIALLEAESFGAGASGHTGGMVLSETAGGDLPQLGDVLSGYEEILRELRISCDLALPGVWEVARRNSPTASPISWSDSGELRVVKEVPGGSVDPGKVVSGLARAADANGALLFENARVDSIRFEDPLQLNVRGKWLRAKKILFATNAQSLELAALSEKGEASFTLALATEALGSTQLEALGLTSRKPFYTQDMPYLWGRLMPRNQLILGSGLVHAKDWRELTTLDITRGEAAEKFGLLERRVCGLHPALGNIRFTHRWGGPILIADDMVPVFARHPQSADAIILGAYSGHGVALSVYLGRWAAQALIGQRELPDWQSASA